MVDSTTAAETIAAHAGMRQVRALAGNLRAMGFNVDYTLLICDNTATLKRIVNDKSSDAMGAKNLAVITKTLQEATNQEHKDIWPFHVASEEILADIKISRFVRNPQILKRGAQRTVCACRP